MSQIKAGKMEWAEEIFHISLGELSLLTVSEIEELGESSEDERERERVKEEKEREL